MIREVESVVRKAQKDDDVLATILFGSYVRGERYSDIDICLVLQPKDYPNVELFKKSSHT
ncbi:MAG: nucleotidyltransferase domain-containing protein [Candidatus Korarchaeota archaeon]|nr:nucleotidyltransferase domain-containing protein [Candidatus Korarchaeota archaeon]